MKQTLRLLGLLAVLSVPAAVSAQTTTYEVVQIKDLNTYATPPTTPTEIASHPKKDVKVQFTAIVSSYPKNSGNASLSNGQISRIHIFVVDTNAATSGRFYQSMQIVEGFTGTSPAAPHVGEQVESLNVGDIATFFGELEFYQEGGQFNVDAVKLVNTDSLNNLGKYEKYLDLLKPVEIDLSDLITRTEAGTYAYDPAKYGKYFGMYVKIADGTVSNRLYPNSRPYYAINKGTARIYSADISLRYRNDRSVYKESYNWRRVATETNGEGDFIPPVNGSLVDISGYMLVNQFNPDAHSGLGVGGSSTAFSSFKIVPWDDGIVWLNGEKFVNGVSDFVWNNDITVKGVPPGFSNFLQEPLSPRTSDKVKVSVTILPEGEGVTLTSVKIFYTAGSEAETSFDMTAAGSVYSYEFPVFAENTLVTYRIEANASNNLNGQYGPVSFVVNDAITSIEQIQKTADGLEGFSPFANPTSVYAAKITATVVADSADGAVVIHESAAKWSGIYLANRTNTTSLKKGQIINLTAFKVLESNTSTLNRSATYLDEVVYTVTGTATASQIAALIPVLTTQDLSTDASRAEGWEGMVIQLNNVAVSNRQADGGSDFGEFEVLSTTQPDTIKSDYLNSGFRVNDDHSISPVRTFSSGIAFPSSNNEHMRLGAVVSITGMVYPAFGNPKLTPVGGTRGITGTNYTIPFVTAINAVNPPASIELSENQNATVEFSAGVTFNNALLEDLDGNAVNYIWAMTIGADSATFAKPELLIDANVDASGKSLFTVTLDNIEINRVLRDKAAVPPGGTGRAFWTIWATDGKDTVQASTYTVAGGFVKKYWPIDVKRFADVSNEESRALTFALDQNYPNPFNPSTSIKYSIPVAGKVKLTVYDLLGRAVAVPVNGVQPAGVYNVSFDAAKLASGTYLYRLEQGNSVITRKMLLIK